MSTKRFASLMQGKDAALVVSRKKDFYVSEWYTYWIENYKATTVKKGTLDSYDKIFHLYIEPFLGDRRLSEVTSQEIQVFYNELAKNDYSKSTITLVHALVTNMFKHAYRLELIEKNPIDHIILPRGRQKQERHVLSRDEQEILLRYLVGNEIEDLVIFALATGMRLGEITGLTWENVDFDRNEVHVREILKRAPKGGFYKDAPKTSKSSRTIPILPQITERLKRLKKFQEKKKLAGRMPRTNDFAALGKLVFVRPDGSPYSDLQLCRILKRIVTEINRDDIEFPPITPHCLRHTFATRALENGISAKVVQEFLGHSSVKLTLDLYTHVMHHTKAEEMQKMSALF
ncbi:MAG: site-specific integrase [Lachnospiraceae bacterium]|nr:site-specific integrase [Lachnospiraceae bacterium]